MRALAVFLAAGCVGTIQSPPPPPDAAPVDVAVVIDARVPPECEWGGAPGTCQAAVDCPAASDLTLESGTSCAGPLGCCIKTPDPADDPPPPAGWMYMKDADVTAPMTSWAVAILDDPTDYPLWATTTMMFQTLDVLARVEWHPPDFQNSIVHRGVSLFEPSP